MAHQDGWIELYDELDNNRMPDPKLVAKCMMSRTGIGETMLHWYAIEGSASVLEKLITLGFDINTQNEFGQTPIMEASEVGKWDNVKVLLKHNAKLEVKDKYGNDYFAHLKERDIKVPDWVQNFIKQ